MNHPLQQLIKLAAELQEPVQEIKTKLSDSAVSIEFEDPIQIFESNLTRLHLINERTTIESIFFYLHVVASSALKISKKMRDIPEMIPSSFAEAVSYKASSLLELVATHPLNKPINESERRQYKDGEYVQSPNNIEQEKHAQQVKKLLNESEIRATELELKLKDLQSSAQREIDKISEAYASTLEELSQKKADVDAVMGHISGRVVAGDYEKSASKEETMADWLRYGSLGCMVLIAIALGYSLWETIHADFDWQKSLIRTFIALLLSVPAAYLARESAKHREQQYHHLQTSLDLKAISPFLESLPDTEQHKIKTEIASKIFAGRDFSKVGADPFPLNTQEIIIELIKRFEIPKSNQQETQNSK